MNEPKPEQFFELRTRWLTLIGEYHPTSTGHPLEYWRIEKSDSVIIIPLWRQQIVLPSPIYRPGVGQTTLDFPGGRLLPDHSRSETAATILGRELALAPPAILGLSPLNEVGWAVNSSFSNQHLYGFVAQLDPEASLPDTVQTYAAQAAGVQQLKQELHCLQCRAVLQEWWDQTQSVPRPVP